MSKSVKKPQVTEKRKPGRPPKIVKVEEVEILGIQNQPRNSKNSFEFSYKYPLEFKNMFNYFKALEINYIHFDCTPKSLTISGMNGESQTKFVFITCDCNQTLYYYCEHEMQFHLKFNWIEKIFNNIDKSIHTLQFDYSKLSRNKFNINLIDNALKKESKFTIEMASVCRDERLIQMEKEIDPELYILSWIISERQFKKTITDIRNFNSNVFCIKSFNSEFSLEFKAHSIDYKELYLDKSKIQLTSKIQPDEIFICQVPINVIIPIAMTILAKDIKIFCQNNGVIMFENYLSFLKINTIVLFDNEN